MTMTDPLADMLTRIRNAQQVEKSHISMPGSKLKAAIARILMEEGYIANCEEFQTEGKKFLTLELKYYQGKPVIQSIQRVSRPGFRRYSGADEIPEALNGLGIVILSTSQGVMTGRQARQENVGGELLCTLY